MKEESCATLLFHNQSFYVATLNRILRFIWQYKMMHYHVTVKLANTPFNENGILVKQNCICWKYTLHKSCRKNFEVNILISKVFWKRWVLRVQKGIPRLAYSVISVFPGSVRSQLMGLMWNYNLFVTVWSLHRFFKYRYWSSLCWYVCGEGNYETLREKPERDSVDVSKRLREYFHSYYLAQHMSLVILSNGN